MSPSLPQILFRLEAFQPRVSVLWFLIQSWPIQQRVRSRGSLLDLCLVCDREGHLPVSQASASLQVGSVNMMTPALVFWWALFFTGLGALVWTSTELILHVDFARSLPGEGWTLLPMPSTSHQVLLEIDEVLKSLASAIPAENSFPFHSPPGRLWRGF